MNPRKSIVRFWRQAHPHRWVVLDILILVATALSSGFAFATVLRADAIRSLGWLGVVLIVVTGRATAIIFSAISRRDTVRTSLRDAFWSLLPWALAADVAAATALNHWGVSVAASAAFFGLELATTALVLLLVLRVATAVAATTRRAARPAPKPQGRYNMVVGARAAGPRIGIISGFYPGRRFNSHVNHSVYAEVHGYFHIDASAPGFEPRPYFRKLEMIRRNIGLFDWIFWVDDDAYFTDFSIRLHDFVHGDNEHDFIVCRSPSTKESYTKFSAGQFFLRNSRRSIEFLDHCLEVDLGDVKRSFWRDELGIFTNGDQDALVYLTESEPAYGSAFVRLLDHNHFNNRDYEYQSDVAEHFLVHFTGKRKERSKRRFCRRLHLNRYILPPALFDQVHWDWADDGA